MSLLYFCVISKHVVRVWLVFVHLLACPEASFIDQLLVDTVHDIFACTEGV